MSLITLFYISLFDDEEAVGIKKLFNFCLLMYIVAIYMCTLTAIIISLNLIKTKRVQKEILQSEKFCLTADLYNVF